MTTTNNKPLVIYHDNCADGFGAAWAAYKKFGTDGAEYLPMNYNDPRVSIINGVFNFPVEVAGRDVYILDFSFPPEVMYALFNACLEACTTMWVRDHHKTHFEQCGLDPERLHANSADSCDTILDPNKSGCVLAWELFHGGAPVPHMLQLIQDRDLWKWKLEGTRNFATALRSEPMTFEGFDLVNDDPDGVIKAGAAMNRLFDQQLADIVKRPVSVVLRGPTLNSESVVGLSVNCTPQFASEGGHKLAEKSGTFGMTWAAGEAGVVFVSLRSIGDYDVSAIAKLYGGGGHRNAAGFKVELKNLRFMNETLSIEL